MAASSSLLYTGLLIFLLSWTFLYAILSNLISKLPESERYLLPTTLNLHELQRCRSTLEHLYEEETMLFVLTYCTLYIFKQTFAIPGSVVLNLLGGLIFPFPIAFLSSCSLSAIGSSCCYFLSTFLGSEQQLQRITNYLVPGKLLILRNQILKSKKKGKLFYFLLSLRFFPFSPNWFLNLSSPWLNIPFLYFSFSVFIGLMPYNYITVHSGSILSTLQSSKDIFDYKTIFTLFSFTLLSLIPVFLDSKYIYKKIL